MDNYNKSGIVKLRNKTNFKTVDYYLVIPIILLSIIGLFVLQKVLSSGYKDYPANYYRQIVATVVGVLVAVVLCAIDNHFMGIVGKAIYVVSLLLLILVPIDGYWTRFAVAHDYQCLWGGGTLPKICEHDLAQNHQWRAITVHCWHTKL